MPGSLPGIFFYKYKMQQEGSGLDQRQRQLDGRIG
jgi:hypothetical protein